MTHQAPFPDAALASRLEGAEAATSMAFCEAARTLYGRDDFIAIAIGGGYALHYGPGDLLNAVKGVGLSGPVNLAAWDQVETRFESFGSNVVVDLAPCAENGFVGALMERGYRIAGFETVTCRELGPKNPSPHATDDTNLRIEMVDAHGAEHWTTVMGRGFADGGEPFPFSVDFGRVRATLAHSAMLLATWNGEPAGAAAWSHFHGVAHFAGALVLPQFRGRGIQRALTRERLRLASQAGCDLVKLDVLRGSVSHRNAWRAGFVVAYTRPQFIRVWPVTPPTL